jgi:hypothetical protein
MREWTAKERKKKRSERERDQQTITIQHIRMIESNEVKGMHHNSMATHQFHEAYRKGNTFYKFTKRNQRHRSDTI